MRGAEQSFGTRLVIAIGSSYAAKVVAAVITFFLTPFVLHRLGATQFGVWALMISIVSYGSLLDFGIGGAIVKYVAEHRAREEWQQARAVLGTSLRLYLVLACAAALLAVALAYAAAPRLPLTPANAELAWWLALLLGLGVALSLPCSIPISALRGANRFDLTNLLSLTGTMAGAAATIVTIACGGGVRALAVSNIIVMLLMQVPAIWILRRVSPELRFGWRDGQWPLVRRMFAFSVWVSTVSFAGMFHSRAGEVVIGASLPVHSLAPYALAKRLGETAQNLAGQFARVLPPVAAELNALGDRRRLRMLWLASTRLAIALFAPVACALAVFGVPLLRAWAGPQFITGAPVLVLLVLAYLFEIATWPSASVLQAAERYRAVAIASVCSGLAIVGLSIWLVPRMGISGAALGILVPTAVENCCFVLPLTLRVLGIPLREYLFAVAAPTMAPLAVVAAVLFAIEKWLRPNSLPLLAAAGAAGAIVYAAIYFLFSQTATERGGIVRFAQAVRGISLNSDAGA